MTRTLHGSSSAWWLRAVRRLLAHGLAATLAASLLAAPALAADPPRGDDGLLKVPPLARVADLAGVLAPAARADLENKLAAFETAHGSQIAIVLVPSAKPEELSDFSFRVGNAWKIGRAGTGDGVLIVVATQDRRAWIAVARALEGAIPDVAAKRVIRERLAPRFREGDFAGGLSAALDAIFKLIEGEGLPTPAGVPQGKVDAGEDVLGLLVPFVFGGIVVGLLLRRIFGIPGTLLAGGGTGVLAGSMLSSAALGGLAGVAVFLFTALGGMRVGRALGGRRGGRFTPGEWGGGWSGGGWSGGGGGGGFSSGGGGDFSGGGAGGDW